MEGKGLTRYCFETLSKELPLQRVSGLDDVENVKLLNRQEGGGIKIYQGEMIDKVSLVDLNIGPLWGFSFLEEDEEFEREVKEIMNGILPLIRKAVK